MVTSLKLGYAWILRWIGWFAGRSRLGKHPGWCTNGFIGAYSLYSFSSPRLMSLQCTCSAVSYAANDSRRAFRSCSPSLRSRLESNIMPYWTSSPHHAKHLPSSIISRAEELSPLLYASNENPWLDGRCKVCICLV